MVKIAINPTYIVISQKVRNRFVKHSKKGCAVVILSKKKSVNFRPIAWVEEHTLPKRMVKSGIKPTYLLISRKFLLNIFFNISHKCAYW